MELKERVAQRLELRPSTRERLVRSLRNYFKAHGRRNAVIGMSGGIDSALTCALLAQAIGPKHVFALFLPVTEMGKDEVDVREYCKELGVTWKKIDLKPVMESFTTALAASDRLALGNIASRSRMIVLYNFAREKDALVVGTGNRTELLLGYFTKHGDGGVDLLPIGTLYKTQVRALAKEIKVHSRILKKVPTAGLWPGQSDEGEIGATYEQIDLVLCSYIDLRAPLNQIEKSVGKEKADKLIAMARRNSHKGALPPILKI